MLDGLGYGTKVGLLSVPVSFKGLSTGDPDAFLRLWLPTQQSMIGSHIAIMEGGRIVQYGEPEADPLEEYLASLPRYCEFPAETLVLPSHQDPFLGLHVRIKELIEHHEQRLDRLLGVCAEPATVLSRRATKSSRSGTTSTPRQ